MPRTAPHALLYAAVATAWVLLDIAVVGTSTEPQLVVGLLTGSLICIGLAATTGIVIAISPRIEWVLFSAALVVSAATELGVVPLTDARRWLAPAVALLMAAARCARAMPHRTWHTALTLGVGLGILAALVPLTAREGPSTLTVAALATGGIAIGSRFLVSPRTRLIAVLLAVMLPTVYVGMTAARRVQLRRPDHFSSVPAAPATLPSVVLVTLDTVRADHLAPYGSPRVTTPNLDHWVRTHATRYSAAYAVSSWTLPSHASLLTGLYPSVHGADYPRTPADQSVHSPFLPQLPSALPLRPEVSPLAVLLTARGYQTAAIVANTAYLTHEFGLDRGFMHYDDRYGAALKSWRLVQMIGWTDEVGRRPFRSAEAITDSAIRWLDARRRPGQPFFLFVNYMDAHYPYLPPPPYDHAFSDQPSRPEGDPLTYDRALLYLDAHLSRLLSALEQRELLASTLVIITADHGEAFGEHGFEGHSRSLYEEVIRVPLYVKRIGGPNPGVLPDVLNTIGVHRLILRELGLDSSSVHVERDLLAEWHQSPTVTRRRKTEPVPLDRDLVAWLDGTTKWIVSSRGDVEAYDLSSDPRERQPLPLSDEQTEDARRRAVQWWFSHPAEPRHPPPALDPNTVDRMRALGYVDDGS